MDERPSYNGYQNGRSALACRNVAEYAYCPRLFYYMEVEGIHVASHDTEEGQRIHRRVDAPSNEKATDEADPNAPRNVRSLTLTSAELALTATLDLAEVSGNVAIPVEYRKGRPQRVYATGEGNGDDNGSETENQVEPWPTDRIHVGLQVLLLEHAGYEVPRESYITRPNDDESKSSLMSGFDRMRLKRLQPRRRAQQGLGHCRL